MAVISFFKVDVFRALMVYQCIHVRLEELMLKNKKLMLLKKHDQPYGRCHIGVKLSPHTFDYKQINL